MISILKKRTSAVRRAFLTNAIGGRIEAAINWLVHLSRPQFFVVQVQAVIIIDGIAGTVSAAAGIDHMKPVRADADLAPVASCPSIYTV